MQRRQGEEERRQEEGAGAGRRAPPAREAAGAAPRQARQRSRPRARAAVLAPDYRGSGKLEGFAAIVTGGDSGIGRAVAVLFAREGADVTVAYLDEHDDADETKRCIEAEGRRCVLVAGDVKKPKFAAEGRGARRSRRSAGSTCSSTTPPSRSTPTSLEDITDERLDETFRTNIFGYFHMAQAALPHLKQGASIINTGSVTGLKGSAQAARLLGDQGRDPRVHEVARAEPDRQGHPRQRGRAGAGVDAAQSGRRAGREGRRVRRRHRDEASGAARGAVAGVRVPRRAGVRRLHHRHRAAGDRQRRRDLSCARRSGRRRARRRSPSSPWRCSGASSRSRARRRRAPRCARARCGSSSGRRRVIAPSSSHVAGDADAEARARPRRPGARGRRAEAVAQVVDEDLADAVLRPALGDEALGNRRGHVLDDALGELPDRVPVFLRRDRHDDVQALAAARLEEARRGRSARAASASARRLPASPARRRPRRGRGRRRCGPGGRGSFVVAFQVWNSMTLACAAPISAVNESTSTIGSWSGENDGSSSRSSGMRRVPAWRWKTRWPARPAGARTSETGRLTRCGRISCAASR